MARIGEGRPAKTPAPWWLDGAELAVDDLAGADDLAAEGLADRLVAEADADERRAGLGGGGDQREADAGVVGGAGAGGEQDGGGAHRHRRLHVDLVVAADLRVGPELAQVVEEVVGEAVVIVDQEQHSPHPSRARPTCPAGSDGVKGEVAAGSLVGRRAHEGKYLT